MSDVIILLAPYCIVMHTLTRNLNVCHIKIVFEGCDGTILALRHNNKFVNEVNAGDLAGVLLDRTCFHADQGGQVADEGFITKPGADQVK